MKLQDLPLGKHLHSKFGSNRIFHLYENGEVLQSYSTIVAARCGGKYYFTDDHNCSVTTAKQVTQWSGISTAERNKGLKSGKYLPLEA